MTVIGNQQRVYGNLPPAILYEIQSSSDGPGVIYPYGVTSYRINSDAIYTMTPLNESSHGETFSELYVDSVEVVPAISPYTFATIRSNHEIYAVFTFTYNGYDTPFAIYTKINWVDSGRYMSVNIDGTFVVVDMGEPNVSYGVSGYYGTPSGHYNSPPSLPYITFPIASGIFRIPYARQNTSGFSYYGYVRIDTSPVGLINKVEVSGIDGSTYARTRFQLLPTGVIYDYLYGDDEYPGGLYTWVY